MGDDATSTGGAATATGRAATLVTAVIAAMVLFATGCTRDIDPTTSPVRPGRVEDIALVRAEDCTQLADAVAEREQALQRLRRSWSDEELATGNAAGSEDRAPSATTMSPQAVAGSADKASGAAEAAPSSDGTVVAGTNLQEADVDEGDMVKTDGKRLVVLTDDGTLRVVRLGTDPAVTGAVSLLSSRDEASYGSGRGQVLLRGDEAVVLVPSYSPSTGAPILTLARVDLSDPAPKIIEQTRIAGELVATRMAGTGTNRPPVRVVLRPWSSDGPVVEPVPMPIEEPSTVPETVPPTTTVPENADDHATTPRGDEKVASEVRRLLPQSVGADGTSRPIGGCSDVFVEPAPVTTGASSDTSVVSVLTIGDSLADLSPVTVAGGADTAYATTDALYTTATVWGDQEGTAIHRFDLTGEGPAHYTGSGLVTGRIKDQYSLSDRNGALRIVTTTTRNVPAVPMPANPDSPVVGPTPDMVAPDMVRPAGPAGRLAVLRPDDSGTLREVGHLDDIGAGEEVKSVRFLDDRAYVVTFRQTDPLFAIDLSDDTAPKLLGEVKLPGFSEYLHPVGDGRLLGIGSDADPQTGRATGFKATLFDVADPTAPKELDSLVKPAIDTAVATDPHAFTWDPVRQQAVVPVSQIDNGFRSGPCPPNAECIAAAGDMALRDALPWSGAYVLGVDGDHLTLRGTLAHEHHDGATGAATTPILRSVVVDTSIWTVSDAGVGRTEATNPTSVSLLPF